MQGIRARLSIGVVSFVFAATVAADQNDERLDSLFEKLQTVTNVTQLSQVESKIWQLWMDNPNAKIDELMINGITAMNHGEFELALTSFDQMTAADPDFAEGWNKRATVHYLLGNFTESMADIQHTLELEPRHFGALSGMGLIFIKIGDDTGALQVYREVLKIHPHSPSARQQVKNLEQKLRDRMI